MERKELVSSMLKSAGYDENTKTLEVEFSNGGIYQYSGVPKEKYQELMTTPSAGIFFGVAIKGLYGFKKV